MKLVVPKGPNRESRVSLLPSDIKKLTSMGLTVEVESNLGESLYINNDEYQNAGASINSDRNSMLSSADIVARLNILPMEEVSLLRKGCLHIGYLDPFNQKELIEKLKSHQVTSVSMEMIPRTTKAQKMDALSSQASLAGYVAVVLASERLNKIFPMMMTPAGTISPSKVFIIGAGVAGLQAIATAKRLGAKVEAFDTRPVVEEQVQSLGAKFVKVDLGETGQTKDGYAKALTSEQIQKQREVMEKHCIGADVVITTAQLFGRKAPLIVTEEMVKKMKPGSLLIDLAVESGGNVAGSQVDQEVDVNGVKIIGLSNLPGRVAQHASQMYSSNLFHFISEFWDKESKRFQLDFSDEILKGCVITHEGEYVSEMIKNKMGS